MSDCHSYKLTNIIKNSIAFMPTNWHDIGHRRQNNKQKCTRQKYIDNQTVTATVLIKANRSPIIGEPQRFTGVDNVLINELNI